LPGASNGVNYYLQGDNSTEKALGRLAHGQVSSSFISVFTIEVKYTLLRTNRW